MGLLLEINHNGPKEYTAHRAAKPWVWGSSPPLLASKPSITWFGQTFGGVWHHPSSSGKPQGWLHPVTLQGLVPVDLPTPRLDGRVLSLPVKLSQERDAEGRFPASQYLNSSALTSTHLQSVPSSGLASGKLEANILPKNDNQLNSGYE